MAKKASIPPDDSRRKAEAAERMWRHYVDVQTDLEAIRQIRVRIRDRNKLFKKYMAGLNEEYPLFPESKDQPDGS